MTLKKVLTAQIDTLRGLVRLSGIGVPDGLATITRQGSRGVPATIRGGLLTVSTSGFLLDDVEALFGDELTYRVVSEPSTSRTIQTNLVLNPKFKYDATNWTAGPGRTLTRRTLVPLPPRDAGTYVEISPNAGGSTANGIPERQLALTSPSGFGPGTYFISGQVRYDSPDIWLWDDVRTAGTWQSLKDNKGTWQNVKAANSPLAGQPFASLWASAVGPTKVARENRRNLMTNPVVATVGTDWGVSAGTGGVASTALLTGLSASIGLPAGVATAFQATWTTASTSGSGLGLFEGVTAAGPYAVTVTPGQVYTGSVYVRCSKAQQVQCSIGWYDSTGTLISASVGDIVSLPGGANFTRISAVAQAAPAGAVYARVRAYTPATGTPMAVNDTMAATAAQLVVTSTLGTFFSGGSAVNGARTYSWAGTANQSASIETLLDYPIWTDPFQVIGVQAADGGAWVTFQATITIPAGAPANCQLAFLQGGVTREYAVTWWLTTVMIQPSSQTTGGELTPYFDGDTPVPGNPAQNLAPGYDWQTLSGDSSIVWNGTDNNSISIFTGPSQIFAEEKTYISLPSAEELPDVMMPIFLSDPVAPQLALWFDLVEIGDLSYAARAQLYDVLSRGPQIAVSQLRAWPSGAFRLLTRTLGDASIAERLFASGRILFLRNPDPRFPENGWWLHIGDVSSGRVGPGLGWSPERLWQVPFVRVERPEGLIAASSNITWQDVKAGYANWGDMRTRRDDWIDAALSDPVT